MRGTATDIEGTRPGIFYINLQDVHSRPRFGLPTLTAHEAIPGHLWQGAIVNSAGDIPMLSALREAGFTPG